jgi:hypothetical protein
MAGRGKLTFNVANSGGTSAQATRFVSNAKNNYPDFVCQLKAWKIVLGKRRFACSVEARAA